MNEMNEMRCCGACGDDKPLDAYTRRGPGGAPYRICKACRAAMEREQRARNTYEAQMHRWRNRECQKRRRDRQRPDRPRRVSRYGDRREGA